MRPQLIRLLGVGGLALLLTGACGVHTPSQNGSQSTNPSQTKQGQANTKDANSGNTSNSASDNSGTSTSNSSAASNTSDPSSNTSSQGGKLVTVTNPTSITVLVNKTHKLPDGYVPPDLVYVNVPFPYTDMVEKRKMRAVAAAALETMFKAADADGIKLYGESGYRSYIRQKGIFEGNVNTLGYAKASIVSAVPGTSEHQTGLAIDITTNDPTVKDDLVQAFGSTTEGEWVAQHAHEYGFIIRYPKGKQDITGYEYEPWHIRYVGVDVATYIFTHNMTFEEYMAQHSNNS